MAFLLPVVLVMLNRVGLLKAEALAKGRKVAIVVCMAFAAIATTTTDALTMLILALPMVLMYLVAEIICRVHDRRLDSAKAPSRSEVT